MVSRTLGSPVGHRATGFTLVELLVVISIIAMLVSILLPALRGARAAAHAVVCLSNIRQISLGFHMYADDNHGWLPPYGMTNPAGPGYPWGANQRWQETLIGQEYLVTSYSPDRTGPVDSGVFYCPAEANAKTTGGASWYRTHYGMNQYISRYWETHANYLHARFDPAMRVDAAGATTVLQSPDETALIGDSGGGTGIGDVITPTVGYFPLLRHQHQWHVLYLDLHAGPLDHVPGAGPPASVSNTFWRGWN